MDRMEMLERLGKDEDPLELSIEKWQDIVNGKGKDFGTDNCALCEVYECHECPVDKITGKGCGSTPFSDYQNAMTEEDFVKAAKAEVEFLKSLRKK